MTHPIRILMNYTKQVLIPKAIIGNRGEFLADGETIVNAVRHNVRGSG